MQTNNTLIEAMDTSFSSYNQDGTVVSEPEDFLLFNESSIQNTPKGESFHEEDGVRIFIRDGSYCKPKRSLTAYNLFFQEQRKKMIQEQEKQQKGKPKIGFAVMARAVSAQWKKTDENARKVYEDLSAQDKVRHTQEMKLFKKLEKQAAKEQKKQAKEKKQVEQRLQQSVTFQKSDSVEGKPTCHFEQRNHHYLQPPTLMSQMNQLINYKPPQFMTSLFNEELEGSPVPLKDILGQVQELTQTMQELGSNDLLLERRNLGDMRANNEHRPILAVEPSKQNKERFMSSLAQEMGGECTDLFIDLFAVKTS